MKNLLVCPRVTETGVNWEGKRMQIFFIYAKMSQMHTQYYIITVSKLWASSLATFPRCWKPPCPFTQPSFTSSWSEKQKYGLWTEKRFAAALHIPSHLFPHRITMTAISTVSNCLFFQIEASLPTFPKKWDVNFHFLSIFSCCSVFSTVQPTFPWNLDSSCLNF